MFTMTKIILIHCFFFIIFLSQAQPRQTLLFDFNWSFKLGDPSDIDTTFNFPEVKNLQKSKIDDLALEKKLLFERKDAVKIHLGEKVSYVQSKLIDRNWKHINLPHDWAVELPINPKGNVAKGLKDIDSAKGSSIGWYRKIFSLPITDKGKVISIEFEGVYRNAVFWINGHCLGRNISGYMGCQFNITNYINYNQNNTLVVRVDASHDEGWWYEGAGLYRHVWLIKTQPVHVAEWGTFIHSNINAGKASTIIETEIKNDSKINKNIILS